jgi:S1-C subfamily serine protease
MGSPVYKAGLDAGDIIVKLDDKKIDDAATFDAIVSGKNIGDKLTVDYRNRIGEHQTTITLEENPYLEIVPVEKTGQQLSKDQQDFRNAWLSSKVK